MEFCKAKVVSISEEKWSRLRPVRYRLVKLRVGGGLRDGEEYFVALSVAHPNPIAVKISNHRGCLLMANNFALRLTEDTHAGRKFMHADIIRMPR